MLLARAACELRDRAERARGRDERAAHRLHEEPAGGQHADGEEEESEEDAELHDAPFVPLTSIELQGLKRPPRRFAPQSWYGWPYAGKERPSESYSAFGAQPSALARRFVRLNIAAVSVMSITSSSVQP